jgi:alkylation response protein AidB-like acyl-CoA dehydrogenase
MLLQPSDDQAFFHETTARFLDEFAGVNEVRGLRHDPAGYTAEYWRRGAELGWTSFLVDERHGGGSISGAGLVDLTLVAHEFGCHAAPGPLIATNAAASVLSRNDSHPEVIAGLLAGTTVATWCVAEPAPNDRLGAVACSAVVDGEHLVLNGTKRPVEAAGSADAFVVVARTGEGLTIALVPRDAEGVTVRPLKSLDLTRRYGAVEFRDVRLPLSAVVGVPGGAAGDVEWARHVSIVIACAESVGAMQRAFDMTVEWGFDRYSFGRPLASYQALKHRYADMKSWLEASHAIADEAAAAVAAGTPDATLLVSAAKAFIGEVGGELMQDCVQMHGGIGVTFEHDLHLFMRRVVVNRSVDGSAAEHRLRLADLAIGKEVA